MNRSVSPDSFLVVEMREPPIRTPFRMDARLRCFNHLGPNPSAIIPGSKQFSVKKAERVAATEEVLAK